MAAIRNYAMPYEVEWKQGAIEDVTALFDYIAETHPCGMRRTLPIEFSLQRTNWPTSRAYMKWTHAMARMFAGSV